MLYIYIYIYIILSLYIKWYINFLSCKTNIYYLTYNGFFNWSKTKPVFYIASYKKGNFFTSKNCSLHIMYNSQLDEALYELHSLVNLTPGKKFDYPQNVQMSRILSRA